MAVNIKKVTIMKMMIIEKTMEYLFLVVILSTCRFSQTTFDGSDAARTFNLSLKRVIFLAFLFFLPVTGSLRMRYC